MVAVGDVQCPDQVEVLVDPPITELQLQGLKQVIVQPTNQLLTDPLMAVEISQQIDLQIDLITPIKRRQTSRIELQIEVPQILRTGRPTEPQIGAKTPETLTEAIRVITIG